MVKSDDFGKVGKEEVFVRRTWSCLSAIENSACALLPLPSPAIREVPLLELPARIAMPYEELKLIRAREIEPRTEKRILLMEPSKFSMISMVADGERRSV
jgi:hypothetical protein